MPSNKTRPLRRGPDDLEEPAGVRLIGLRRTPTGAQALVRAEDADLLAGHVLVEAPTLEEIAIHIGAGAPPRNSAMSTGGIA